ncbi:MAG: glycoside hydrolase family 13 protein [Ruminococcaceae bacterium]|nr:glycoside hydrolase family 13 protein [Oscillospiraceae bacterium]
MASIYNSWQQSSKTPFGAVKAGEAVRITIRVPAGIHCETPILFLQKDGGSTAAQYPLQPAGREDGADVFTVRFTVDAVGLHFYWFDLWVNYQKLYQGAYGEAVLATEEGKKFVLTVYDPAFRTPEAVRGGVMYQIFPDRFMEGEPGKLMPFSDRIYRADKQNEPYFWGEVKSYGSLTQDYYGGDLAGIEKRLPFLYALGVSWIYLNPIFEAHSNHRYNTADYMKVDPLLGTNADFARLCKKAKTFGIRIILDGVFSHTGADSLYFNKEGRYPTVGAWQGPQSRYRDWYYFMPDGSYDSWWGFETLPTCNKNNPAFRKFICGENGVIDYWLQQGAAGFRLDVADELPDDFIVDIRTAVKRGGEDMLLIGEVWEDAVLKEGFGHRRAYFMGQELDGVMNYPFRTAILDFLQNFDSPALVEEVMTICEHYPAPALNACTVHLSSHDTIRAITALVGEPIEGHERAWQSGRRLSPEQYHLGILRLQLGFVLQFTLPGIPCVYYGDEIAMQGYADPFNRGYYDWSSGETHLIPLMLKLAGLRKQCPAFHDGTLRFLKAEGGLLVYERDCGEAQAAVAINCSGWPVVVDLLGEQITVPMMDYAIRASNCEIE